MLIILAVLFAVITSAYLSSKYTRLLLVVIYHLPFRFWRPYLSLYDGLENHYTFELLGGERRFKSYEIFLSEYHTIRPTAVERFKALWNTYARQIGRDYIIAFVIALGVFWRIWWVFAGSFLLVQLLALSYQRLYKHQDPAFLSCVVISILLQKETRVVKTTGDFIKRSE